VDPAERTQTALREVYAFYRRTRGMYASLLRDEPLVPIVQRNLRAFYAYLDAVRDVLMAGRAVRGRAARSARSALGHALAFPTWHSLTQDNGLRDEDAAALMSLLVELSITRR
jgi:hypothetical protein